MKTQKTSLLTVAKISLLALSTTLLVSCGDDNTVASNSVSTSPIGTGSQSSSSIRTQLNVRCASGEITPFYFSTTGASAAGGQTTLYGPFNNTRISGTVASTYVGVTYQTNDLLIVDKLVSGSQLIGYNITMSLCIDDPLITRQRMPTNPQIFQIVLDNDVNSGLGQVDLATGQITVPQYQYYQGMTLPLYFSKVQTTVPTQPWY